MKFQCIECKTIWGAGNEKMELYSHGLCKDCARELLIPTVRRKQIKEGNFDCFGKARSYCDQLMCKYRLICVDKKYKEKEIV